MPKTNPCPPSSREWSEENMFRGHGRIRCNACGEPLRDHELTERCPQIQLAVGERMTTTSKKKAAGETRAQKRGQRQ